MRRRQSDLILGEEPHRVNFFTRQTDTIKTSINYTAYTKGKK